MSTTMDVDTLTFGPGTVEVDGVSIGETEDAAQLTVETPQIWPEFQGRGKVKGTGRTGPPSARLDVVVKEISAVRLAWAFPGAASVAAAGVGTPLAGLDTTLAADPALAATNLKVASVTTVAEDDFIRVAAPGVDATVANSEIVRVVTVGTTGGGGTGLDIVNDIGGGMLINHANAAEVNTVLGTTLALDAEAGDTNIKLTAVDGFLADDFIRIGYYGHYEIRQVVSVGTLGADGTGVELDAPLNNPHAFGAWVIEVDGRSTTTVTPAKGIIPDASFHTVILRAPGVDGVDRVVTLSNAVGTIGGALSFDFATFTGLPITFETTYSDSALDTVPFNIDLP